MYATYTQRPRAHAGDNVQSAYADQEFIGGCKEGCRGGGGEGNALSQVPMRTELAIGRAPVDGGNNNFATHSASQPVGMRRRGYRGLERP